MPSAAAATEGDEHKSGHVDYTLTAPDFHLFNFFRGQEPLLYQVPEVLAPQSGASDVCSFAFEAGRAEEALVRPGPKRFHLHGFQGVHLLVLFSGQWRVLHNRRHLDGSNSNGSECLWDVRKEDVVRFLQISAVHNTIRAIGLSFGIAGDRHQRYRQRPRVHHTLPYSSSTRLTMAIAGQWTSFRLLQGSVVVVTPHVLA